jgi:hypothetical protein
VIRPDQRYPLTWPEGWKRTPRSSRSASPFKTTPEKAYRELMEELERLGARNVIVSSNLKLRQDGAPYANQPRHEDEGVAVYFTRKGKDMALACDKFAKREDNMRAITKTIDAIRGIERWGSSDMMERAFTGFAQLANDGARKWWEVLGCDRYQPLEDVVRIRNARRSAAHPDKGGDPAEFQAITDAYLQCLRERTGSNP